MEEIAIAVDGKEFRYWTRAAITLSIDAFSTLEFGCPFEADRFEFRETFRPFTFRPLEATLNGEPFFTGTKVGVGPSEDFEESSLVVSGYSLPGVLGDCNVPASALPLDWKKVTFQDVVSAVCEAFSLGLDFQGEPGAPFDKVALEVDDVPLTILADLAKQRSRVISNTADGKLLCWKSIPDGKPVAEFSGQPVGRVRPSYNAQEYFSEITGFNPPKRKRKGSRWTERNPWLRDRLRPSSFKLEDTDPGDAVTACKARLGRMFANMMSLVIDEIPTWRDPQGRIWEPNTMVTVLAPDAMIYSPTKFLIRDVTLVQEADKETAELGLVLPGAFSGEVPARLPWGEPTNPDDPLSAYEATL